VAEVHWQYAVELAMQSMAIEDLDVKRTCIPVFAGFETFNSCA